MLLKVFLFKHKLLVFILIGLGLTVGSLEALFIFLAKSNQPEQSLNAHWMILLLEMGLLVSARTAVQFLTTRIEMQAVFAFLNERRKSLLQTTVERTVPAHRTPWRGALASAWNDGLENLGQGILSGFRCLAAAAQALVLIPMLFLFSWKLALGALVLAIPALLASRLRAGMLLAAGKGWQRSQAELAVTIEDFADGFEAHIGNGRYHVAAARMDQGLALHAAKTHTWETAKAVFPPALEWFFFMALAALAVVLARYGGASERSLTAWVPFGALLLLIYRPIREWARHYPASLLGGQAWKSLSNLAATLAEYPIRQEFPVGPGATIRLIGVRFGYARAPREIPDRWVFNQLDLELNPNGLTWISGRNGSGKSTLLKLLAGVETSQAGAITLPDSLSAWSRPIAYLSQKAVVEPDWLDWQSEYRTAHPASWNALDGILGLDAIISRTGSLRGLSGGERQRLCLARAFASPCGYLLLDEPTTWLSAEDREGIMEKLLAFWQSTSGNGGPVKSCTRGAAIVSHEPFIGALCSSILHMKMESDDPIHDIPMHQPATEIQF